MISLLATFASRVCSCDFVSLPDPSQSCTARLIHLPMNGLLRGEPGVLAMFPEAVYPTVTAHHLLSREGWEIGI